tara:strand:+ start:3102 stop:3593 length:492 start_codon:yes stop_codon:yes gene_type:complete
MKSLSQIIKEKTDLGKELAIFRQETEKKEKVLLSQIRELERLEKLGTSIDSNIDLNKLQLAESVLIVSGNPVGKNIHHRAISRMANNPDSLKREFIGNKRYEGYYQECDCEYGYGPRHGSIVDRIGLNNSARNRDLTEEEKDACIYYLTNIEKIQELSKSVQS